MKFYNYIFDSYFKAVFLWISVGMALFVPIAEWQNDSLSSDDFVFVLFTVLLLSVYYVNYRLKNG
jgi:hypothetical protein